MPRLAHEAEGEGFEPSERRRRSTVFKTAAINRSATPPRVRTVLSYPIWRHRWELHVGEKDDQYMRMALDEASRAAALGEVPIGAVVVCCDEVVARGCNRRETDADPSAHAEFMAMVAAAHALGRWRLTGCTVYVTVEPCLMCAGLMVNARIDRCVYGAANPKGGALGTVFDVSHTPELNHEFEVVPGVLAEECAGVMRDFFRSRRG